MGTEAAITLSLPKEQQVRPEPAGWRSLAGKRIGMVTLSPYPADPRPRRAAKALLERGMIIDLICIADGQIASTLKVNGLRVTYLPICHRRGGKFAYAFEYSAFILASSIILAWRALRRRYDVVYVHNMPDILVLSALIPKALGAKVILDLHDPMPELMMTIFQRPAGHLSVRLLRMIEKWSIACADLVVTVNIACKRLFSNRSCSTEKIGVVMNSPDEKIFCFRQPPSTEPNAQEAKKTFIIMYHGSLVERNGLDLAVAALPKLRSLVPALKLRIYGKMTPFLNRVLQTVRDEDLQDCVEYLGPKRLEELPAEIEKCDVGVIPNPRNPFTEINTPTRILEYLALGKPVVAPRTRGIEDYFSPTSLVFFDPGNADDLAEKLQYVYLHQAEMASIVRDGQQIYLAHSWAKEKETLIGLVSNLL